MRILMGRAGIWAFLLLMTTFVTVLAASTPIFERLVGMGGGKRGQAYLPGPKRLVTPDEGFQQGEIPPELPPEPEPVVAEPAPETLPEAASPLPRRTATMASRRPAETYLRAMTAMAERYFDLGEDAWRGRKGWLESIERMRDRGYDLLGDPQWLMRVVYGARSFEPGMSDRAWRKTEEIVDHEERGRFTTIRGDGLYLGFRTPDTYPLGPKEHSRFERAYPRPGPWPVLISTLEKQDVRAIADPARASFDRRFGGEGWAAFHRDWFTLIPVAPGADYVDEKTGEVKREYLTWQFVQFLRHYHLDFDRIVLEGGPEALRLAASQPMMFAGVVLRPSALDAASRQTVVNYAHLPVFIRTEDVAKDPGFGLGLGRAGHTNITVGDDAQLRRWLRSVRRGTPRNFTWRVTGPEHQFAHWINLEQVDFEAAPCQIRVEVDEFQNEIRIEAEGVSELSLFLNDDIADLDRPLRVRVNGSIERDERITRDLDMAFSRDPLRLRESMYFGLVFPARLTRIRVPAPEADVDRR